MPLPLSKVVDVEDFDSPDLRPYLLEVNEQEAARFGSRAADVLPDAKQWECAMALRTLDVHGAAAGGRMVAGIGAGTEATIFALARRGALVFPVDRYLARTLWSDVAPAGMLIDPARYSALALPRGHVIPVHSNALALNLPSESFDAVFSDGAFEHFGSLDHVAAAAAEIGRILKPGGVAAIATQFRLDGPDDLRWFDDNLMLFTPELLERYIIAGSGLVLRAPIALAQSDRTFQTRRNVVDFIHRPEFVHALDEKRTVSPNLVLYHDGFLFCSVVLTLHKDRTTPGTPNGRNEADEAAVTRENASLAADLERFQRSPSQSEDAPQSHALFGEVEQLRAQLAWMHAEYARSNAWKKWRVMRPARFVYRRVKRWRG